MAGESEKSLNRREPILVVEAMISLSIGRSGDKKVAHATRKVIGALRAWKVEMRCKVRKLQNPKPITQWPPTKEKGQAAAGTVTRLAAELMQRGKREDGGSCSLMVIHASAQPIRIRWLELLPRRVWCRLVLQILRHRVG